MNIFILSTPNICTYPRLIDDWILNLYPFSCFRERQSPVPAALASNFPLAGMVTIPNVYNLWMSIKYVGASSLLPAPQKFLFGGLSAYEHISLKNFLEILPWLTLEFCHVNDLKSEFFLHFCFASKIRSIIEKGIISLKSHIPLFVAVLLRY